MNKVIIELKDEANFELALKTLGELEFVNDIKFIQAPGLSLPQNQQHLHPTELKQTIKGWDNVVESEDFWKSI
jgi:hypothetical protein